MRHSIFYFPTIGNFVFLCENGALPLFNPIFISSFVPTFVLVFKNSVAIFLSALKLPSVLSLWACKLAFTREVAFIVELAFVNVLSHYQPFRLFGLCLLRFGPS